MPFKNQISARQTPPGRYKKFRRGNDKFGSGIDVIWGITAGGKTEVQSIRFDSSKFTTDEARTWLKEHKYKTGVTAATGSTKDHADGGAPATAGTAGPANSASSITVQTALRPMSVQYQYNEDGSVETHEVDIDNDYMLESIIDNDIDLDELRAGAEHELEHTSDRILAMRFALDHLIEIPDYYTRLKAAFPEEASEFKEKQDKASIVMTGDGIKDKDIDSDSDDLDELGFSEDGKHLCVEAFEAGEQTDAEGQTASWSEKDLDDIASKANAQIATKPIPVVIGHPKDSSPAYGWVEKVKRVGSKLRMKLSELNPSFVEALKSGAYKGRSISLYDDNKVRHLGFLGGAQPAITGLQPFSFNEDNKYRTYTFSEEGDPLMDAMKEKELSFLQKLIERFRIKIDEKERKEFMEAKEEPKVEPAKTEPAKEFHEAQGVVAQEMGEVKKANTSANAINDSIKKAETVDSGVQSTAKVENAKILNEANEEETENEKLKQMVATLEAKVKALEAALEKNKPDNKSFCEQLIKEGRLLPKDREITLMSLEAQTQIDEAKRKEAALLGKNFSEGAETGLDKMKKIMLAQPKVINFGEFPNLPGVEETKTFPEPTDMAAYIESRMKDCMAEEDKLGLTNKTSYFDIQKKVHRECMEKYPAKFREYVAKQFLPPMGK